MDVQSNVCVSQTNECPIYFRRSLERVVNGNRNIGNRGLCYSCGQSELGDRCCK
jgi:hypothetical protein